MNIVAVFQANEVLPLSRFEQVIDNNDICLTRGVERRDQGTANETRTTGYDDHGKQSVRATARKAQSPHAPERKLIAQRLVDVSQSLL